ncbi:MAG: methyltransferase domain-containing protein [Chloroflexi bacterium]|nr:methyltransferase domain-containing protein [Chloroflexota bacterium]
MFNGQTGAEAKACCADLYRSDMARMVLGDTLHPGGLQLTNRLGRLMGLEGGWWVADLASGTGSSAAAISRVFHCRVIGVEYSREAALEARAIAHSAPVPSQAWFTQGDAESPPLRPRALDAVIAECSLSVFPDKQQAIDRAVELLKPGGRIGISDVTVEPGSLPSQLNNALGQMLCVTGALGKDQYGSLLTRDGMINLYREDASVYVTELLSNIKAGISTLNLLGLTPPAIFQEQEEQNVPAIDDWEALLDQLIDLVDQGLLGYWLYVAEKP